MRTHNGIWFCAIVIGASAWMAAQADEAPSDTSPPTVAVPAGASPPAAPADNNVPTAVLPPGQAAPAAPPPTPASAEEADAQTAGANLSVSDDELKRRVEQALQAHYGLGKTGIRVSVIQGVVTLRGTVPTSVQIDQAKDVVSRVPGVQEINNELRARSGG